MKVGDFLANKKITEPHLELPTCPSGYKLRDYIIERNQLVDAGHCESEDAEEGSARPARCGGNARGIKKSAPGCPTPETPFWDLLDTEWICT